MDKPDRFITSVVTWELRVKQSLVGCYLGKQSCMALGFGPRLKAKKCEMWCQSFAEPNVFMKYPHSSNTLFYTEWTWPCVWGDLKVTSTSRNTQDKSCYFFIIATRSPVRRWVHIYTDRFSKKDTFEKWPHREMSKLHVHNFVCIMNVLDLCLSWLLTRVLLYDLEIHTW